MPLLHFASPAFVGYLPPEYFQAGHRGRTFPAAVVLTGHRPGVHYPRTALGTGEDRSDAADDPGDAAADGGAARATRSAWTYRVDPQTSAVPLRQGSSRGGERPLPGGQGAASWARAPSATRPAGAYALKIAAHLRAAGLGCPRTTTRRATTSRGDLRGTKDLRSGRALWWYLKNAAAPEHSLLVTSRAGRDERQGHAEVHRRSRRSRRDCRSSWKAAGTTSIPGGGRFPRTLRWVDERLGGGREA
ncbi:alpha/beta hydrolase-fold protein [Streptomyces violaceorubidus]